MNQLIQDVREAQRLWGGAHNPWNMESSWKVIATFLEQQLRDFFFLSKRWIDLQWNEIPWSDISPEEKDKQFSQFFKRALSNNVIDYREVYGLITDDQLDRVHYCLKLYFLIQKGCNARVMSILNNNFRQEDYSILPI